MDNLPEIYKCTVTYTVLIADIVLMLECCRKYIETNDVRHVQYLCTIARAFSKKVSSLGITESPDLREIDTECTDLCLEILKENIQEAYKKIHKIAQSLEETCRKLLRRYRDSLEEYLNKVREQIQKTSQY